jgi:hypothetical protein
MKLYKFVFAVIIGLFSTLCSAESHRIGDWTWSTNNPSFYYAGTVNPDKHFLGQYCYIKSKNCMYLARFSITCRKGSEIPAMMNSDRRSSHIKLYCGKKLSKGGSAIILKKFKDVKRVIRGSNEVTFAIPMTSGRYKIIRFSLDGASSAISAMRTRARDEISRRNGQYSQPSTSGDDEFM